MVRARPVLAAAAATAAAVLSLTACVRETPIAVADLPALRPGLWSFVGRIGAVESRGSVCLARLEDALGRLHAGCAPRRLAWRCAAIVVRDACRNPDGTLVRSEVVLAGDFASAFTADTTVRLDGPMPPVPETRLRIDYARTGACPGAPVAGDDPSTRSAP
jgi:hypothetical protein